MDVSGYLKLGGHIVMRRTTAIWRRLPKMGRQLPTRHLRHCATVGGIGIQFSTSNNTTSLYDHWLVYRHCAKLSKWYKAEKYPSSYKQATSLSPNQSASYMHLFSSTRKTPKEIGINENSLKSKRSKPTWFCRPSTELQRNREQWFKGWCHLPWLSDVEVRMALLMGRGVPLGLTRTFQFTGISANADPH